MPHCVFFYPVILLPHRQCFGIVVIPKTIDLCPSHTLSICYYIVDQNLIVLFSKKKSGLLEAKHKEMRHGSRLLHSTIQRNKADTK